ncbi:MAG: L-fucokinase [Eubacteriales bacterium]|nr:L-fucokinase [Eubacteriales bacterium]
MKSMYRKMKNLFLRQSYLDAWEDYARSIRKTNFPRWDYIILTSSNEEQARSFRQQIAYRLEQGVIPEKTKYLVLPDPAGKRIGSGGATLNVIRYLSKEEGFGSDFHGKRILVIHSGGDSKRVPQYSVCGKLFSPVPRELPDGRGSTLFDEFLISMAGVPARFKEGMLVLSGDVLLLFNPLQIDAQFRGAAAISMKSPVEIGVDHGVYLNDGTDHVRKFLHKQEEATLRELGAVNEQDCVDLDTGAVLLDSELVEALLSLISSPCEEAEMGARVIDEEKYAAFVNDRARVSFYGDFLYPLASDSTLEQYYKEKPEGDFCGELLACREKIWEVLSPYQMKLICLSPAEFIHFGTTRELRALMTEEVADYEFLDWKKHVFTNAAECAGALHTCLIGPEVRIEEGCYLENCSIKGTSRIERGAVVSGLALEDTAVPSDTVLHGVKLQENGGFLVRTYGVLDNPKKTYEENGSFLKGTLKSFLDRNQLVTADLWADKSEYSLWNAALYPVCRSWQEAVEYGVLLVKMSEGFASAGEIRKWKVQKRLSLQESFSLGDTEGLLVWKQELEDEILVDRFLERIRKGEHYIPALKTFGEQEITDGQFRLLMDRKEKADFSEKIRILYDVSRSMKYKKNKFQGKSYDALEQECFETIKKEIFARSFVNHVGDYRIACDEVKVTLPVRVNWGGGWTDTPPYCNEHGGVVLNAAIRLKGTEPIEVEIKRIPELRIEFGSVDTGAYGKAVTAEEIQDCHNPYDPFALHKAAIIACGILPLENKADLQETLEKMGGGFYLSTRVRGVPKGSGLGTSSILAGACVRAFSKFLGQEWSDGEVYDIVLNLEQIMSTGGGWQDQVGGLTPGIKFITSRSGIRQHIHVEQVEISEETKKELQERFALIYTGQRRLARNLLREVVGNYIGGRPESVKALEDMQKVAVLMKFALERGNIDEFAALLNEHWEISKRLDAGSTNTCIDQIFEVCNDLIDGRFISGAGGGGFLQVVLKKGVKKEQLSRRLHEVFQDSGVDVWECEIV